LKHSNAFPENTIYSIEIPKHLYIATILNARQKQNLQQWDWNLILKH